MVWLPTLLAGVFVWEHVARLSHWTVRPSVPLEWVVSGLEKIWHKLGVWCGYLSGIWELIYRYVLENLEELLATAAVLGGLLWRGMAAPIKFVWGYVETISHYVHSEFVFGMSTVAILILIGNGLTRQYMQGRDWSELTTDEQKLWIVFGSLLLFAVFLLAGTIYREMTAPAVDAVQPPSVQPSSIRPPRAKRARSRTRPSPRLEDQLADAPHDE